MFLNGGNDCEQHGHPDRHGHLRRLRGRPPGLAMPNAGSPNGVLAFNARPASTPGQSFGFHPNMPEIRALFNQNKLAVVTNVGPLVEPMTQSEYMGNSKKKPFALFSHSDQVQAWRDGRSTSRSRRAGAAARSTPSRTATRRRRLPDDHLDLGLHDLLHRPQTAALDRNRLADERARPERFQRLPHGRRPPHLDGLPAHDRHGTSTMIAAASAMTQQAVDISADFASTRRSTPRSRTRASPTS